MMQQFSAYSKIIVEAEREVAYDSPDHLLPWGTRRENSKNSRFNKKLYYLYPRDRDILKILDMGCAGGAFVRECLNDGCLAVGLEGSDFSKKYRRAEWATMPDFLFTCDITGKFEVLSENDGNKERVKFDVVTSWEVMEHIAEDDIPKVAENVKKHLQPGGLWIMSVSPNEEVVGGVRLHQTVKGKDWWIEKFAALGLRHLEIYDKYFNTQYVRGPKYGAPNTFHLVLSPDPSKAPALPIYGLGGKLYDAWLGSRAQRFVQRLITGEDDFLY